MPEPSSERKILLERLQRYRKSDDRVVDQGQELVLFTREQSHYALPIESLSEIRLVDHLTALPGVAPTVKGILNLRGRLVVVHDLASCWSGGNRPPGAELWVLIGFGEAENVGILADEVTGIQRYRKEELRALPLVLHQRRKCFFGVHADGTLILRLEGLIKEKEFFYA